MFKGFRVGRCTSTTDYPQKYRNDNNDIIVLLSTELHSTRRADRIKRTMFKHYEGIKYIHADVESNMILIIGEVDPKHLRQGFEDLNDQKAEFVSAQFVKEAARLQAAFVAMATADKRKAADNKLQPETKPENVVEGAAENKLQPEAKPDNVVEAAADKKLQPETKPENVEQNKEETEQKKEDSMPRENLQKTIILKMSRNCNCDGCVENAKKTISKCNGVDSVAFNFSKNLITIKGTLEADDLIRHLQTKLKLFIFEVVSPEDEKADGKEDKSSNGRVENDEKEPNKKVEDDNDHKTNVEDQKEPILPSPSSYTYTYQGYCTPGPYNFNYGYALEPRAPPPGPPPSLPPHQMFMFSDDNPNACSIM